MSDRRFFRCLGAANTFLFAAPPARLAVPVNVDSGKASSPNVIATRQLCRGQVRRLGPF
jgi:hypothetical protein